MKVWIGTEAAHDAVVDPETGHAFAARASTAEGGEQTLDAPEYTPVEGARVATISLANGLKLADAFLEVTRLLPSILQPCSECGGSGNDAGAEPGCAKCEGHKMESVTWVASDNALLATNLAEQFGVPVGVPEDVEDTHHTENGPPGENAEVAPVGPVDLSEVTAEVQGLDRPLSDGGDPRTAEPGTISGGGGSGGPNAPSVRMGFLGLHLLMLGLAMLWAIVSAQLRTAAGRDFQSRVMGDPASTGTGSYAAANYIALTESAVAPADSDTTLAGELTDSGLARAQATYAHVAGATTYTLTKTFTSGTATPRTPAKAAVFNAGSGGSMPFETPITNPPPLQLGDSITITYTVSLT